MPEIVTIAPMGRQPGLVAYESQPRKSSASWLAGDRWKLPSCGSRSRPAVAQMSKQHNRIRIFGPED
jgi:hypothetical protein